MAFCGIYSNPDLTFKAAKDLFDNHNVRIIIGPIFNENNLYLNQLPDVTFLSLSNKITNNYSNVISAGINAISQIKAIKKFQEISGCPTIVNTSFNVRGEPIVRTPQDAYRCFMRTEMDVLVLQNQILFKEEQPKVEKNETWRQEFDLD